MSRYSRPLAGAAAFLLGLGLAMPMGHAQAPAPGPTPAPGPAPAASPAGTPAPGLPNDPVVARVDGFEIRLSDVAEATQGLPEQLRGMPPGQVFPMVLDHLVKQRAMTNLARKDGLDKLADVRRMMDAAADRALQNAYISRQVSPQLTEEAVRARFQRDVAGGAAAEEVHARHILVASQDAAMKILAELKAGKDFAALAKQHSTDPGAQNGGDLGFFKKDDMVPEFAAAAFALKPGEISPQPVKTQFGFHIIRLEARRAAPPPSFEEVQGELRQRIIQEAVSKLAETAVAGVKVERMNLDGSAPRATDGAQPPPAPARR